jgi:hypothetical protein
MFHHSKGGAMEKTQPYGIPPFLITVIEVLRKFFRWLVGGKANQKQNNQTNKPIG